MRKKVLIAIVSGVIGALFAAGVTMAVYYWIGTQTIKQTIVKPARGTLYYSEIYLPDIIGPASATYTQSEVTKFDKAVFIFTSKTNVPLKLDFKNAPTVAQYYTAYTLRVVVDTEAAGSSLTGVILTVDLTNPVATVPLDAAGIYRFDYEVSITAKEVTSSVDVAATFQFDLGS